MTKEDQLNYLQISINHIHTGTDTLSRVMAKMKESDTDDVVSRIAMKCIFGQLNQVVKDAEIFLEKTL